MGIYGAMATAITGLTAQSTALEHISANIANSQTTGYKRVETNFIDLIPDAPPVRQSAGAVIAQARSTNDVAGDIQNADVDTFMAINGDGYFVISEQSGQVDGVPIFDGRMSTLRRFQEEVEEVRQNFECGIRLGEFNEYQEGDIIECYKLEKVPQTL